MQQTLINEKLRHSKQQYFEKLCNVSIKEPKILRSCVVSSYVLKQDSGISYHDIFSDPISLRDLSLPHEKVLLLEIQYEEMDIVQLFHHFLRNHLYLIVSQYIPLEQRGDGQVSSLHCSSS